MKRKPFTIELSLRPYFGKLHVASNRETYEAEHRRLFKSEDRLCANQDGRFFAGEGKDGYWTYLIWAKHDGALVHELSHVVLHLFGLVGIDPREAMGEPFCYLISQLLLDYKRERREMLKTP